MKKIISLLMCIAMLFGMVACNGLNGDKDTQDGADSGESVERIKLVEDGKAVYTVIYPNDADPNVLSAMRAFINKVKEVTGVTLPNKSDYVRFGQTRDPDAKEILFGKTNYDETQEILSGLHADEYVIKAVDEKIVIVSTEDSYLLAAVNYFSKNLIQQNLEGAEDSRTLYFEEYHFMAEGADKVLNISGKPIQDYTIVYESEREGYRDVATRLRDAIAKFTGYSLPVVSDALRAEGDCEILVGNTNRKLSEKCYKNFVDWLTYKVVVESDKLQIVSGGPFSARICVDEMSIMLFAAPGNLISSGTYLEKDMRTAAAPLSEGADVRIMTANVLTSWWGEDTDPSIPPAIQRAEIAAAALMLYKPDVVGLQEAQTPLKDALAPYMEILSEKYGLEYSMLHTSYENKQNLTSVLYRSDVLTVKDNGVYVYSFFSRNYHMRNITWAVFQKGTEQFMVANTHWSWEDEDRMQACADELTTFVNEKRAAYNMPIFTTGDYNAKHEVSAHLEEYLANADVKCLQLQAKESGVLANECGGCNAVGTPRTGGNYIDHIIGCGNYTVLRYETVTGSMVHWLSDHAPHYADVVIN